MCVTGFVGLNKEAMCQIGRVVNYCCGLIPQAVNEHAIPIQ